MRRTIYIGGAAATFVSLALVLAVTDIPAVIAGEDTDPVSTVLTEAFGATGSRIVLFVVLLSFLSCAMSLQAAASRLAYSYGRDDMIMGSSLLAGSRPRGTSRRTRCWSPPWCRRSSSSVRRFSTDAITKIVSFAALGIYIGFQMVVLAALRARLKGWVPSGKYSLGRWGLPVNIGALVYGVVAMVNMAWPRTPTSRGTTTGSSRSPRWSWSASAWCTWLPHPPPPPGVGGGPPGFPTYPWRGAAGPPPPPPGHVRPVAAPPAHPAPPPASGGGPPPPGGAGWCLGSFPSACPAPPARGGGHRGGGGGACGRPPRGVGRLRLSWGSAVRGGPPPPRARCASRRCPRR